MFPVAAICVARREVVPVGGLEIGAWLSVLSGRTDDAKDTLIIETLKKAYS